MDQSEQLSTLIGDIYDGSLRPDIWTCVLEKAACYVGGSAAALFSKDANFKTGAVAYEFGIDPHFSRVYFEHYIKLDPSTIGHYFATVGETVSTADLVPYEEFLQTRFYREWAQPQGLVDFVAAPLDKSAASAALFGVFRHECHGVVDAEVHERMRLIVPHVRRSVVIGRLFDAKSRNAATLIDTIDGISAGMFLVDCEMRIVHANLSGHTMLSHKVPLRGIGQKLKMNDPAAARILHEAVRLAGRGGNGVGTKAISMPLSSEADEPYVAHLLPLTSRARSSAAGVGAAVAALFIHKATLSSPSAPEVIAKAFKLTPSELRVMLAIVEVGGVPEVAEALGVAESTVKTHLSRLFVKTGTTRQLDLAKLLARYSNGMLS